MNKSSYEPYTAEPVKMKYTMLDAKLHDGLLQKNLFLLNVHLPETMLRQG